MGEGYDGGDKSFPSCLSIARSDKRTNHRQRHNRRHQRRRSQAIHAIRADKKRLRTRQVRREREARKGNARQPPAQHRRRLCQSQRSKAAQQ